MIDVVGKIRRPRCSKCGRKIRDWRKAISTDKGIYCIYCAKEGNVDGSNNKSSI